jgi:ABC-2 type transport system permease protein
LTALRSFQPAQQRLRRELITELVRKDLKVKYQGSALGFLWSLANPILILVVYSFVFQFVLKSNVPLFGLFLMSGLLIWNFFTMSVSAAATSITGNAGLIKKVPFPHSALPLASVGFAGAQVALQYIVLLVALLIARRPPIRPELVLILPALVVALIMTVGMALLVSSVTVRYRDMQHFLEVALFAWFWITPIVYPGGMIREILGNSWGLWAFFVNPMAGVVVSFQRALYGTVYYPDQPGKLILPSASFTFYLATLAIGFVVACAFLALGYSQFTKRSADFAEEL